MDNQDRIFFDDNEQGSSSLIKWREYLYAIYERRWVAITTFFIVLIATVIWTSRQKPMYRARSSMYIDLSVNNVLNIPGVTVSGTPAYMYGQYINTQVKSLKSKLFIAEVVDELKKSDDPAAKDFIKNSPNPVGEILSSMSVKAVDNSRLVGISVQNAVPERTALFANTIATQFIKRDLDRRMEASMGALVWLQKQTEEQKTKLSASEMAIQQYKERNHMVSLDEQQDIVISKMKSINNTLTQAENELGLVRAKRDEIVKRLSDGVAVSDIPIVVADPAAVEAKEKVTAIKHELEKLNLRYKGKHPKVEMACKNLADAREEYKNACYNVGVGITAYYKRCLANVADLRSALKKQKTLALELGRMQVEYNSLKRNAETDRKLYQTLLERMKEIDLAGKLETSNIRIDDLASVPTRPFKPQKAKSIIQAAVLGIALGLFLALVVHFMDDRIRCIEDFETVLGVIVLGMVPKVAADVMSLQSMMQLNSQDAQVSEAFRGIYARIMLDKVSRDAKVIMIVSANAAEGKSFVSTNLAFVFAQNSHKTLLIDADLRRPTQHKLFGIGECEGLPHLIRGESAWDDLLINGPQDGLDLLTGTGAGHGEASQLLASDAMARIIDDARKRYDRVIIDCPPVFGVSDAMILLPKVDGVIFVAYYNKTHRRAVNEATKKLIDSQTTLLGAVINAVELSSHSYYYHRYGYNHYYGRSSEQTDA